MHDSNLHPVNHPSRFLSSPHQLFPASIPGSLDIIKVIVSFFPPVQNTRFGPSLPYQLSIILDTMSRQRRHTISGPRPSTQDMFAAGP